MSLNEIKHPYYGADGYPNEMESFADLKAEIEGLDEGMNHVYRFDWIQAGEADREDGRHELRIYVAMPRKENFASWFCPIDLSDVPAVVDWLRSDRILGALKRLWAPILDPS